MYSEWVTAYEVFVSENGVDLVAVLDEDLNTVNFKEKHDYHIYDIFTLINLSYIRCLKATLTWIPQSFIILRLQSRRGPS